MPQLDADDPFESLSAPTKDMHRAITSLVAELTGIDGMAQRVETCTDPELKLILAHHRDKKKEHAAMLLEWMRRRDVNLDQALRDALFKAGPITAQHKS